MTDAQRRVVAFVQARPRLLAALYDLDLMPLDLLPELVDARAWSRTVRVVALYAEAAGLEPPWLAEIESRQRVSDGLIRDERNDVARFFRLEPSRSGPRGPLGDLGDVGREDADAYIGAGAVSVRPESGSYRSPVAAAAEARVSERASCAAIAAQVEHEALGSPIAQDAARRIKLAILALR